MSRKLLFDSDFLIDLERRFQPAHEFIALARNDDWSISMITYGEYFQGTLWATDTEKALERFERTMDDFEILPITRDVMKEYARLKSSLGKQGNVIGTADLIIAATAFAFDHILVTRNQRHFGRIPNLAIINVTSGDS